MNKEMCMYDVKKCHCVWICFIITHIKYDFKNNIIRSLLFDERRHHGTTHRNDFYYMDALVCSCWEI